MTDRDIHFEGFARLVIDEVYANGPQTIDVYERIIAQRVYDLVEYILNHKDLQGCEVNELCASDLPDLTEFPPT